MNEIEFQDKLLSHLEENLPKNYSTESQFTSNADEANSEAVYDLGLLRNEDLEILVELKTENKDLKKAKKELRAFSGLRDSNSDIVFVAATPTKVIVFDYEGEISSEEFDESNVERVSEIIVENLTS